MAMEEYMKLTRKALTAQDLTKKHFSYKLSQVKEQPDLQVTPPPKQTLLFKFLTISCSLLIANLANKIGTGFGCCPFGISYVRGTVADSNSYHPR